MKKFLFIVIASACVFLEACKGDDDPVCTKEVSNDKITAADQTKLKSDSLLIVEYLAANSITDTEIKNNVRYRIIQLGTGSTLSCLEGRIKVKYQGRLMKTGTIFDPDPDKVDWEEQETTFTLSGLLLGWQIVLPSIPAGSRITLYIPSGYGYGVGGGGGGVIPSNANLIFEIELVEIL